MCPGHILHEWVPTQDLPVVLIVIVAAQTGPTGACRPSGTLVFQLLSVYC